MHAGKFVATSTSLILAGIEAMHRIKKEPLDCPKVPLCPQHHRLNR